MAQFTYADLLDFLGLSNWQFVALALLLLLLWTTLSTLWKVGAIDKVKVAKKLIPEFSAVFISYEGSYDNIGVIYSQSVQDFEMVFKFSNYFAIYYSLGPHNSASRAVIGVAVNKLEQSKISLFLSKFPMYKRCLFPASGSLSAKYPLVNSASSQMVVTQVYPVIEQTMKELKIERRKEQIMEIYHLEAGSPYLDVIYPIQNEEAFDIWYPPTDYSRIFDRKAQ